MIIKGHYKFHSLELGLGVLTSSLSLASLGLYSSCTYDPH